MLQESQTTNGGTIQPLVSERTESQATADALSGMLLHLALAGRVASLPGGRYQQLPEG